MPEMLEAWLLESQIAGIGVHSQLRYLWILGGLFTTQQLCFTPLRACCVIAFGHCFFWVGGFPDPLPLLDWAALVCPVLWSAAPGFGLLAFEGPPGLYLPPRVVSEGPCNWRRVLAALQPYFNSTQLNNVVRGAGDAF